MKLLKTEESKDYKGDFIEVGIYYLGGRKRDLLMDDYIQTSIKAKSGSKEADVNYKPFTLKAKVMEDYVKIKDNKQITIDDLDEDEYERIFNKYFRNKFKDIFGANSEEEKVKN